MTTKLKFPINSLLCPQYLGLQELKLSCLTGSLGMKVHQIISRMATIYFNLNLMDMSNTANISSVFHNSLQILELLPVISRLTRISVYSFSFIDNMFSISLGTLRSCILIIPNSGNMPIRIIHEIYFDSVKMI